MPRYFFDCFDGRASVSDRHGIELADAAEVADHSTALAVELLQEAAGSARMAAVSVTVRSEAGDVLHQAHCTFHGLPGQS